MRLQLPFRAQVEDVRRLAGTYGPRWFTIAEAIMVLEPDGVTQLCLHPVMYRERVRQRLIRLVARGVLLVMRHPARFTRITTLHFQVSPSGRKMIEIYQQHAEAQQDLDEVLEDL